MKNPQCVEVCPVDCIILDPDNEETLEELKNSSMTVNGRRKLKCRKLQAVIDIGQIQCGWLFWKPKFCFSLINETKSRSKKISEGCYENGGNLQKFPMERAYQSLKFF